MGALTSSMVLSNVIRFDRVMRKFVVPLYYCLRRTDSDFFKSGELMSALEMRLKFESSGGRSAEPHLYPGTRSRLRS